MNTRRIAVVGLLVATSLGLAACTTTAGNSPGSAPTTTPAQLSPADAFTKALGTLKSTSFDAILTRDSQGVTIKASVDYASKAAAQTATVEVGGQTLSIAATEVGTNVWVKVDFGSLGASLHLDKTKWYLVDMSKLKPESQPFEITGDDPLGIGAIFGSITNLTRTDATHLGGSVDLTKVTGPQAPDKDTLNTAGAAAAAVPFTAILDAQGRFTDIALKPAAANKDLDLDIAFSNYGSPTPITAPPAADVVPATDAVYQGLNGASGT